MFENVLIKYLPFVFTVRIHNLAGKMSLVEKFAWHTLKEKKISADTQIKEYSLSFRSQAEILILAAGKTQTHTFALKSNETKLWIASAIHTIASQSKSIFWAIGYD